MNSNPTELIWAGKFSLLQDHVSGGALNIRFTPGLGNYLKILSYVIGKDDYGAGRIVTVAILDRAGSGYAVLDQATNDNVAMYGPSTRVMQNTITGSTVTILGLPKDLIIHGEDILSITVAALVEDETLSINIRCACLKSPDIDISNSAGTPVLTTTHNEIIGAR